MTEKQVHMYWRLWRRACAVRGWNAQDSALRHTVHRDLLGYDISHQHLSNADLDYVKHTFILWADPENLEALIFLEDAAGNGDRKRLLYSIGQLAPVAYRRHIAVDLFDTADLAKFNNEQLTLLRNTLHNRAHTKEVKQRRAGQTDSGAATSATTGPRKYTLRLPSRSTPHQNDR